MNEITHGGNALRLPAHCWRIGPAFVELDRGEVTAGGVRTRLRPKALHVLAMLLAERGTVVMRKRIFAAVWAGLWVVEDSLTQCIVELRRALGPGAAHHLVTIHRRGYMLAEAEPVAPPREAGIAERMAELEARAVSLEARLRALEADPRGEAWPLPHSERPDGRHRLS